MRIGPISLFALVIILCLAVMAVLSVTTAQATYAAAERQASFTADTYANERAGQEFAASIDAALAPVRAAGGGLAETLAAVRAALPAGAELDGSTVKAEFTADSGRALAVVLDIQRTPPTAWRRGRLRRCGRRTARARRCGRALRRHDRSDEMKLEELLREMVDAKASDIFIIAGLPLSTR